MSLEHELEELSRLNREGSLTDEELAIARKTAIQNYKPSGPTPSDSSHIPTAGSSRGATRLPTSTAPDSPAPSPWIKTNSILVLLLSLLLWFAYPSIWMGRFRSRLREYGPYCAHPGNGALAFTVFGGFSVLPSFLAALRTAKDIDRVTSKPKGSTTRVVLLGYLSSPLLLAILIAVSPLHRRGMVDLISAEGWVSPILMITFFGLVIGHLLMPFVLQVRMNQLVSRS